MYKKCLKKCFDNLKTKTHHYILSNGTEHKKNKKSGSLV